LEFLPAHFKFNDVGKLPIDLHLSFVIIVVSLFNCPGAIIASFFLSRCSTFQHFHVVTQKSQIILRRDIKSRPEKNQNFQSSQLITQIFDNDNENATGKLSLSSEL
jgi:hypothetical protein